MSQLRLLLAEDHPLLRDELAHLLAREGEVVAVVDRGDQVVDRAVATRPDVVVLDISLPGRSGLQALPALRCALPAAHIVILTSHADPLYRDEALRRGADAYVVKWQLASDLLPAIRRARPAPIGLPHGPA